MLCKNQLMRLKSDVEKTSALSVSFLEMPPKPGRGRGMKIAPVSSNQGSTPILQSMTLLKNSNPYNTRCLYCRREIERDPFIRVQTWSPLRRYIVFHLYDFVVDVHGKSYYHDCIVCYFTTLFKFLGDSLVVFHLLY